MIVGVVLKVTLLWGHVMERGRDGLMGRGGQLGLITLVRGRNVIVVLQHTQMLRHGAVHHGHPSFIGLVILKIQVTAKNYNAVIHIEFKTQVK